MFAINQDIVDLLDFEFLNILILGIQMHQMQNAEPSKKVEAENVSSKDITQLLEKLIREEDEKVTTSLGELKKGSHPDIVASILPRLKNDPEV